MAYCSAVWTLVLESSITERLMAALRSFCLPFLRCSFSMYSWRLMFRARFSAEFPCVPAFFWRRTSRFLWPISPVNEPAALLFGLTSRHFYPLLLCQPNPRKCSRKPPSICSLNALLLRHLNHLLHWHPGNFDSVSFVRPSFHIAHRFHSCVRCISGFGSRTAFQYRQSVRRH